jgi:plastocyanin
MRTFSTAACVAALVLAGTGVITGQAYAHSAKQVHKTVKAVNVDPNNGIYAFAPKKLSIKVGTKVTWTNPSDTSHNVTSSTASWTFAKNLDQNATVSFTFKKAGVFKYTCTLHAGMTGKITVTK